jgi:hypothetical protein
MEYPFLFVFIMIGLLIIFAPTKIKLKFDGKIGRYIYNKAIKSTGDEAFALKLSGTFYNFLGSIFVIFPLFVLLRY